MLIILGVCGVIAILICGSIAGYFFWRNATLNQFYSQRHYPISTQAQLPAQGNQLILAGRHYQGTTESGSPRTGTDTASGLFFIDLAQPTLTQWSTNNAHSNQDFIQRFPLAQSQVLIHNDGTHSLENVPETLTSQFRPDFLPKRSPNGDWFAYTTIEPGGGLPSIWTMHVQRADGTNHQVIFEDEKYTTPSVAWAPQNEQLVVHAAEYVEGSSGDRVNALYWVNRDGSQLTQLYREAEAGSHTFNNLLVHPSGTILYSIRNQLFALDPITQQVEMIYEMSPDIWLAQLKVSPDGTKLGLVPDRSALTFVILDISATAPVNVAQDQVISDASATSITQYLWLPNSQGILYKGSRNDTCQSGTDWQRASSWRLCNHVLAIQHFDGSPAQSLIEQHIEPDLIGILQR